MSAGGVGRAGGRSWDPLEAADQAGMESAAPAHPQQQTHSGRVRKTAPARIEIPFEIEQAIREADGARYPDMQSVPDLRYVAVKEAKRLRSGGYEVTLASYRTSIAGPLPGQRGEIAGTSRTWRGKADTVTFVKGPTTKIAHPGAGQAAEAPVWKRSIRPGPLGGFIG